MQDSSPQPADAPSDPLPPAVPAPAGLTSSTVVVAAPGTASSPVVSAPDVVIPTPAAVAAPVHPDELETLQLRFNEILAAYVCFRCKCLVDTDSNGVSFRRHLRKYHGCTIDQAVAAWGLAEPVHGSASSDHPLNAAYRKGTTAAGEVLPKIEGLAVVRGQQCAKCMRVFLAGPGFQKHLRTVEKDNTPTATRVSTPVVSCQSLSANRRLMKLFMVPSLPTSDPTPPPPLPQVAQSPASRLWLERSRKRGQIDGLSDNAVEDWSRNAFLSMSKAADRLESYGLSLSTAAFLGSAPLPRDHPLVGKLWTPLADCLKLLFRKAQVTVSDWTRFYFVRAHFCTPGLYSKTKTFRFVNRDEAGEATLHKYAQRARIPLVIAFRCFLQKELYPRITISPDLADVLGRLADFLQVATTPISASDPAFHELVHSVFFELYFEVGSSSGSSHGLFAGVVYACLCVRWEPPKRHKRICRDSTTNILLRDSNPPHQPDRVACYATATSVGALLSGIMYSVSCVGMLKAYVYNGAFSQEVVYERVKSLLLPQVPVALQLLVQLRSLSTTLRPFEVAITEFTPCTNPSHGLCGITEQVEMSTLQIGTKVRLLHTLVDGIMFEKLLLNHPLPRGFRTNLNLMVDRLDDVSVGYNAMNDQENSSFMNSCDAWFTSLRDANEAFLHSNTWMLGAKRVLRLLLAAIHLSSGSPGRGTELGTYQVINTAEARRSIYFRSDEVMFLAHYDKRRSLTGGETPLISRYTDSATSYLLKVFLIFIRPWMQARLLVDATPKQKLPINALLTSGVVLQGAVGSTLTAVFADIGMRLTFSLYRHHQTGLLKEKCQRENLGNAYITLFGVFDGDHEDLEDDDSFEELTPAQRAGFETAAHTDRTAFEMYAHGSRSRTVSLQKNKKRLELNRQVAWDWHVHLGLRSVAPKNSPSMVLSRTRTLPVPAAPLTPVTSTSFVTPPPTTFLLSTSMAPPLPTASGSPPVARNLHAELLPPKSSAFDNGFTPPAALSKLFGEDATWKSLEQHKAMKFVADNQDDLLVVIRTGGGKSAVVAGPILFETGFTVWISPLRALQSETRTWMRRFGIAVSNPQDTNLDESDNLGNVVLISPNDVQTDIYQNLLVRLSKRNLLNRVVIDEAHLVLTARSYRKEMESIGAASNWGQACRCVLLSATVPPNLVNQVLGACGSSSHPRIVRGDPRRPNLQLKVSEYATPALPSLLAVVVKRTVRDHPLERSIIYCLTIETIDLLYERISAFPNMAEKCTLLKYHGQMSQSRHAESLEKWSAPASGTHTLMLATEAFGCGIDVPNVRQVTIYGGSPSVLDFWQAAGRAGRDGMPASVTVLYSKELMRPLPTHRGFESFLHANCGVFEEYMEDCEKICRRIGVETCLGGRDPLQPSNCSEDALLCNVCATSKKPTVPVLLRDSPTLRAGSNRSAPDTPLDAREAFDPIKAAHARRDQAIERDSWDSGLRYLRNTAAFLKSCCPHCLLLSSGSSSYLLAQVPQLRAIVARSRNCSRRCSPSHCFRCMQMDHRASDCLYLRQSFSRNRKSEGPFICGGCRTTTLGGRLLHSGGPVGKHCHFAPATAFCLVAYAHLPSRNHILRPTSPYMQSVSANMFPSSVEGPGRFIAWLTEERPDDNAGLLLMLQYLFRVCDLEKLKNLS